MTTYSGYDVWPISPVDKLSQTVGNNYTILGENFQSQVKLTNQPTEIQIAVKLIQKSNAARRDLKDWFNAKFGALTPFWVQSFSPDFITSSASNAGSTTIYIVNNMEVFGLYNISRHAYDTNSGQRFKISSPVQRTDGTIALTTTSLPADLAQSAELQSLYLVRFLEDTLTIENSDGNENVSFASFTLKEVQKETP
jgi:hypothetical protein